MTLSKCIQTQTVYNADNKTWRGIESTIKYGPESSIGQVVLEALQKDPHRIAQICYPSGKQYTRGELAALTKRVALNFQKLNVPQGQIIGICGANSEYVAPLFFGAMLAGLTVNTLDPSFDKDGIKHIFSITKPALMFCDGAVYETVKAAFEESSLKATIYTIRDHIKDVPELTKFLQENDDESTYKIQHCYTQTAAILCSSGTTGQPKGVCMSHASLLNMAPFHLNFQDKLLCFSTLYWLSGLICLLSGTIEGAVRIISDKAFSPEDFFDIIEKYKINVIFTPPSQIAMAVASPEISNHDLSSVATYFCGGSAVHYSLLEKMRPHMPNVDFITGYGMSEVCGAIAFGAATSNGSTGQIATNIEVKVIDDSGKHLGPREQGEICIRTPFPWAGYYDNAEATKAIRDSNGWISSGDLGYFDEEGNLYVVDRKKDIFKYNNFHFSPSEIEDVISELPDVAEVCVCGLPDIVSSHLPAAAIVRTPGSSLSEDEVYQHVANKMAHFKHLRGGVYFIDKIPKTASGKNLRRNVTEICERLRKTDVFNNNTSASLQLQANVA